MEAQAAGDVAAELKPDDVAAFLITTFAGLRVRRPRRHECRRAASAGGSRHTGASLIIFCLVLERSFK